MPLFAQESLERLRQRIDLVEALAPSRFQSAQEPPIGPSAPSTMKKHLRSWFKKGTHQYYCFGCGAHGDAIQFPMTDVKMGFSDAAGNVGAKV